MTTITTTLWNKTSKGYYLEPKVLGDDFSPSFVVRGRPSNVALTTIFEKTPAFLPSELGFRSGSVASEFGATYADLEDVHIKNHEGRYFETLSKLMADQPDNIDEIHVASISITAKTISAGSLTDKVKRTSGAVPFVIGRENSSNPVLVWNDQYDRDAYPGITAATIKAAVNGESSAINFKEGATPNVVVITRHSALVTLLIEKGLVNENTPVVEHASEKDVAGKHVFGALPLRLAALADRITEIPLFVPAELRGTELSIEQVRELAGTPKTYKVSEAK